MNACKIVIFMWDLNWSFKSFGYISVRRMWLVVQCARLSLCLLHLCDKSTLYQLCCAVYFVFAHLCHRHSDHSRPPWAAAGPCWSRGRWPWGNSQPRHPLHRSPGHWRAPPTRDRQFFSVVSLVILLTIYLSEVIVFLSQYGDLPL